MMIFFFRLNFYFILKFYFLLKHVILFSVFKKLILFIIKVLLAKEVIEANNCYTVESFWVRPEQKVHILPFS